MKTLPLSVLPLVFVACGPPETRALLDVKAYVSSNLDGLVARSTGLCAAAPANSTTGWDATRDAASVARMRAEWVETRRHYERVEGAIAVLFPELDVATDERYDGFVEAGKDDALFDDVGVTGMHAIERILFSDRTPARVVSFEVGLGDRYVAARFPATGEEAVAFKTKLCARLVKDVTRMRDDFRPLALDNASAFRGVIGSMEEQLEKAVKAATGEEESRYAQVTLADMRANLEGAQATYAAFRPWLASVGADAEDKAIQAGFKRVGDAYAAVRGDALPEVPSSWSSVQPSAGDLQTPFGQLYALVRKESDPDDAESLVAAMQRAAARLSIPELP